MVKLKATTPANSSLSVEATGKHADVLISVIVAVLIISAAIALVRVIQ